MAWEKRNSTLRDGVIDDKGISLHSPKGLELTTTYATAYIWPIQIPGSTVRCVVLFSLC